jgi:hypothetical protein
MILMVHLVSKFGGSQFKHKFKENRYRLHFKKQFDTKFWYCLTWNQTLMHL